MPGDNAKDQLLLTLEKDLIEEFRKYIKLRYGDYRGSLSIAGHEALSLWIEKTKEELSDKS